MQMFRQNQAKKENKDRFHKDYKCSLYVFKYDALVILGGNVKVGKLSGRTASKW